MRRAKCQANTGTPRTRVCSLKACRVFGQEYAWEQWLEYLNDMIFIQKCSSRVPWLSKASLITDGVWLLRKSGDGAMDEDLSV